MSTVAFFNIGPYEVHLSKALASIATGAVLTLGGLANAAPAAQAGGVPIVFEDPSTKRPRLPSNVVASIARRAPKPGEPWFDWATDEKSLFVWAGSYELIVSHVGYGQHT